MSHLTYEQLLDSVDQEGLEIKGMMQEFIRTVSESDTKNHLFS